MKFSKKNSPLSSALVSDDTREQLMSHHCSQVNQSYFQSCTSQKMVISSEKIREIAARELERHVHDPDFRLVLKDLVQQVEGNQAKSPRFKTAISFRCDTMRRFVDPRCRQESRRTPNYSTESTLRRACRT